MYSAKKIEDVELLYTILREENPDKQIDITYNWNVKEYYLKVSNIPFKQDPEVPLDLNIEVIYGDSVDKHTPLLLRNQEGLIKVMYISDIIKSGEYTTHDTFKIYDTNVRINKEYSLTDYEIFTDKGWCKIKKVIRHKTDKKMYSVYSNYGYVKVTEDHSLCDENGKKLNPKNIGDNTKLKRHFPEIPSTNFNYEPDSMFLSGMLRSCLVTTSNEFIINRGTIEMNVYNIINKILKVKSIFAYENKIKFLCKNSIESFQNSVDVLNSSIRNAEKFIEGYLYQNENKTKIYCKNNLDGLLMYTLLKKTGVNTINVIYDNNEIILDISNKKIKEYIYIEQVNNNLSEYVYDIETETGKFHGGIGDIILYNTDSVFLRFKYNRDNFEQNRKDTFNIATVCGDKLTKEIFNRPPIEMEFEKVFQPFILLTKKRYIAKKYEDTKDPFKMKCIDAKGIALTRRDYCVFVKKCYSDIIDAILKEDCTRDEAIKASINVFKGYICKIDKYDIKNEELVVSSLLAKSYKTDNLAHVILAKKLRERKEDVQVGDRIPYIFIECDDSKVKKSDLAEDPLYADKNGLKFNRLCYLEQLSKPILGFYKIVLKDNQEILEELIDHVNTFILRYKGKAFKLSDFKEE